MADGWTAAAFAGGAAIHKGLGPAHAVAVTCDGRQIHHGTMIGVALLHTATILARHLPDKGARVALDLAPGADIGPVIHTEIVSLRLPSDPVRSFSVRRFRCAGRVEWSMFNRMSPCAFTAGRYREFLEKIGI